MRAVPEGGVAGPHLPAEGAEAAGAPVTPPVGHVRVDILVYLPADLATKDKNV
jgi:hypothetical protein